MAGASFLALGAVALVTQAYLVGAILALAGCVFIRLGFSVRQLHGEYLRLKGIDLLLASTESIVISTDRSGLITGFNPAAERALGYSAEEVLRRMTPKDLHTQSDVWDQAYGGTSEAVSSQERHFVRKDGTTFPAILTVSTVHDQDSNVVGYLGIGIDISSRESHTEALREKQELIESVAATSPTIFYIFDTAERRIIYANRELPYVLGYTDRQIASMGQDPLPSLIHPEDLDILFNRYQSYANLHDGEILETEFRCLTSAGELRWMYAREVVFKRLPSGQPSQILVNVLDVTEKRMLDDQVESQVLEIQDTNLALEIQTNALEEANSQLEALAFTDGLTGIANHRSFQEELAKSFEQTRKKKARLSLMLIDVDRFKQYNDTYGHPSGDIVLRRVAATILGCCPAGCTPARYGGEEFAVICPKFSASEVAALAEKIRIAIQDTPWPERGVTISVGTATVTPDVKSPSDLVGFADNALYSSKTGGRNRITQYETESDRQLTS